MKSKSFNLSTKLWSPTAAVFAICLVVVGIYAFHSMKAFSAPDAAPIVPSVAVSADKKTVCLDPGHGGPDDPGAVNGDVIERDINLLVADRAKTLLEAAGYRVVMTRSSNDDVLDNTERADYCNSQAADIVVSIHHNDFTDNTTDYATALYYKTADLELAQDILDATSSGLNVPDNGLSTLEDNVLVKTEMPAALSEAFFVSSDFESDQINQVGSTRLNDEAAALVAGIQKYFANQP